MSTWILWNGEALSEDSPVVWADNRAFRYGDGFFDTLRVRHGRPLFWDAHWQRIQSSSRFLHFKLPPDLTSDVLMAEVRMLCERNGMPDARVRIQFMRDGAGHYRPEAEGLAWMVQSTALPGPDFRLNEKGLVVGLHRTGPVHPAPIGNHKTLNALPYVMAGVNAREKDWDDALLMNHEGRIVEAISSNILLIKDRELLTPDLSKGGLPGIMRTQVMALARSAGYQVSVGPVSEREMHWADECLLTNSVQGIQWVMAYGAKRYFHRHADHFVKELNRLAQFS